MEILHMTPVQNGAFKAEYNHSGQVEMVPVVAMATWRDVHKRVHFAPVISTSKGFELAGVSKKDAPFLPFDPVAERYVGLTEYELAED
ncbi:hypothetical protein ACKI1I_35805 [Streptomyces turgidiscabies]|uniref:hypothetical protein n=1 Tax=Streptomyces turgidiscabies TaxID=85558 RepID=UPI0038F7063E